MKPLIGCLGSAILLAACGDVPTVESARAASAPAFALQTSGTAQSGVIHACVNSSSGALKIVETGRECGHNSRPLQWNVTGPSGPSGPTGPAGPAGPTSVQAYSAQASGASARVFCPTGTKVVGGGAFSTSPSIALHQNFPIDSTGANPSGTNTAGWQGATVNFAGTVQVFVLCASS